MFRYYSWLPVDLEPEYKDGYTCDKCGKDFFSGPFYHQSESGEDYCVPCGASVNMIPFQGLVSSLLFRDSGETLADLESGSFVIFAFQSDQHRFGLLFSDGANVTLHMSPVMSVISVYFWPPQGEAGGRGYRHKALTQSEWQNRFPWLSGPLFRQTFPLVIRLHDPPQLGTAEVPSANRTRIIDYTEMEAGFSLALGEGWEQVFDSESAVEIIAKDGRVVALFQPGAGPSHIWEKTEAQELYEELTTMLHDNA